MKSERSRCSRYFGVRSDSCLFSASGLRHTSLSSKYPLSSAAVSLSHVNQSSRSNHWTSIDVPLFQSIPSCPRGYIGGEGGGPLTLDRFAVHQGPLNRPDHPLSTSFTFVSRPQWSSPGVLIPSSPLPLLESDTLESVLLGAPSPRDCPLSG